METERLDFDQYALDNSSKLKEGAEDALLRNRMKMWAKAYAPVLPAIQKAQRILDYGCGAGEFLTFLASHTQAELVGYEISESQIKLARVRCQGQSQTRITSQESEIGEGFDLVFCHHVVEHISDAALPQFMRSLTQPVGPQGQLVIATPNGVNPIAYSYYMSTDRTHLRMHSVATLAELLRETGFSIEEAHRELPQSYDLMTFLKTMVWKLSSWILRWVVMANAAGVRGGRYGISMASTFYVVAGRASTSAK